MTGLSVPRSSQLFLVLAKAEQEVSPALYFIKVAAQQIGLGAFAGIVVRCSQVDGPALGSETYMAEQDLCGLRRAGFGLSWHTRWQTSSTVNGFIAAFCRRTRHRPRLKRSRRARV